MKNAQYIILESDFKCVIDSLIMQDDGLDYTHNITIEIMIQSEHCR